MTDALKPCPLCGSKAVHTARPVDTVYFSACLDCGARGAPQANEADAVAAWSTRPVEDALAAERDALREEVERLRAALERIARLAAMVGHDLQGRVEGGKVAAVLQCADLARAALAERPEGQEVKE